MHRRLVSALAAALLFFSAPLVKAQQPVTRFGEGAGEYARLLDGLGTLMMKQQYTRMLGGRERTVNVPWIRDEVHVLKGAKYFASSVSDVVDLFLERQTEEGLFYDYVFPIASGVNNRLNFFAPRYWKVYPGEETQMHRLPVEADVEYLMVKGAHHVWQATGDTAFVRQWLPTLENGMTYAMSDPLRWSAAHRLVKRAYTIDTWDFRQLSLDEQTLATREQYSQERGDTSDPFMNIDAETPMGIFHGDNSGYYQAARLLAVMHSALGDTAAAGVWNQEANVLRARANRLLWNGRYYRQFMPLDSLPPYYDESFLDALSLSNTYDINRGLPTQDMAASIIRTYQDLRSDSTFAEWYTLYPAVRPYFAGYEPGTYVNGGLTTIVAGELAKAAFQHGFEEYGAEILRRVYALMQRHDGMLPVMLKTDGSADGGAPDNWGQAAVVSALVEGLAGVVDRGTLFSHAEVSPRWMAAGIDRVEDVIVAYGPSDKRVHYDYRHDAPERTITLALRGDAERYAARLLLPEGTNSGAAFVDGQEVSSRVETIQESRYVVVEDLDGGAQTVQIQY